MTSSTQAQAWRDGELLVMKNLATAPKRCVKCNASGQEPPVPVKLAKGEDSGRIGRGLGSNDGDALRAVYAVGAIVNAASALSSIQRATVNVYVCEAHRPRRRNTVLACIILGAGIVASITCTILAMRTEHAMEFSLGGIAAFMLSMICGGMLLKLLVRPERIEGDTVWLKGAGAAFLQSLEQLPDGESSK